MIGKKSFWVFFPYFEQVHIKKDVGQIPITLSAQYWYDCTIACYKQNDNIIGTFYVSPDQATTIDLLELRVILVPTDIVSIVTFCPKQTTGTGVSINFEVE